MPSRNIWFHHHQNQSHQAFKCVHPFSPSRRKKSEDCSRMTRCCPRPAAEQSPMPHLIRVLMRQQHQRGDKVGLATNGFANGTINGSSPAGSPLRSPEALAKIILMAIRNRMMPPEMETVSARRLRNARISHPNRNTSITRRAISNSRTMIARRLFGSGMFSTDMKIGRFPSGSIIRINKTAAEMISFILKFPDNCPRTFCVRTSRISRITDGFAIID